MRFGAVRMLFFVLVALASMGVHGCKESGPDGERASVGRTSGIPSIKEIEIPRGLTPEQESAAKLARRAFLSACAIAEEKWALLTSASLQVRSAAGYRRDDFDWDMAVWITLVYKDELEPGIGGHHLPFYLGAGKKPGIVAGKRLAIEFCRFPGRSIGVTTGEVCRSEGGEDCFLELDQLKALDAARPAAVAEAKAGQRPVTVHCFGHGFDPPAFWNCSRKAADCRKARRLEKREENEDYRVRTSCKASDKAHCFIANGEKTVCAPDPEKCVRSRKEWTAVGESSPCQMATVDMIDAASRVDD